MTLTTIENKKIYPGTGSQSDFSFPYLFVSNDDLVVSLVDTTTGITTVLTHVTHYTLVGAGVPAGGTVTMVTDPTITEELVIERVVDLTQLSSYENTGEFPAETVDSDYVNIVMMVQQLQEQVNNPVIAQGVAPATNSVNVDLSLGAVIDVILDQNVTIENPTNPPQTGSSLAITYAIKQDGTGSRLLTAFGSKFKVATSLGSITLSTAGNTTDYISVRYKQTEDEYHVIGFATGVPE